MEVAHVCVVRGEEHADVGGQSSEDERLCAEVAEEYVERGGEEAGVLGLQDEVVILFGPEQFGDGFAARALFQAVVENLFEVRLPLAEVVVDVDDGDARLLRATLQHRELLGHRQRLSQKFLAALELKVVDNVNQKQRHVRLVRHVAVQVFVLRGHPGLRFKSVCLGKGMSELCVRRARVARTSEGTEPRVVASGSVDCGAADCGLKKAWLSSFRNPQSTIRNRHSRPLAAGGSDLRLRGSQSCEPESVMSAMVAPVGSLTTQKRPTLGMSVGGTQTLPPSSQTWRAFASTSSTAT